MPKRPIVHPTKPRSDSLLSSLAGYKPKPISQHQSSAEEEARLISDAIESDDPEFSTNLRKAKRKGLLSTVTSDRSLFKPRRIRHCKLHRLIVDQPEVYQRFLATIRVGCFDWVAAESIRISYASLNNWMKRGSATKKKTIYRKFYLDVMQAQAQARLTTEIQVRKDNPEFWLRNGPGKSKPGRPGWTETTVVEHGEQPLQVNVGGTVQHQHAQIGRAHV